jgi:hypothetical protein
LEAISMTRSIPFDKIDSVLSSLEEALSKHSIAPKLAIPLMSPDSQDRVKAGQKKSMEDITRKAAGRSLLARLGNRRDELVASTGLAALRRERQEADLWLTEAEILLTGVREERKQELPCFNDIDDAVRLTVTFAALSSEDCKRLSSQVEKGRAQIARLDDRITEILKSGDLDVELSDQDHEHLAALCPEHKATPALAAA